MDPAQPVLTACGEERLSQQLLPRREPGCGSPLSQSEVAVAEDRAVTHDEIVTGVAAAIPSGVGKGAQPPEIVALLAHTQVMPAVVFVEGMGAAYPEICPAEELSSTVVDWSL